MNPCVVSSFQLAAIMRHHPCFADGTDIYDLSHIITHSVSFWQRAYQPQG